MSSGRHPEIVESLVVVRRIAAAAASLAALVSVRPWLELDETSFRLAFVLFAGAAVFGRWTEGFVAGAGGLAVALRAHVLLWAVLATNLLLGVAGVLAGQAGGEVEAVRIPIVVFLATLLVVSYGLSGHRSFQLHALATAVLLFFGLSRGGPERCLWWAAWTSAMAVLLAADRIHRDAGRVRFEEPGTATRAAILGFLAALVNGALFACALAVGPRREGGWSVQWEPGRPPGSPDFGNLFVLLGSILLVVTLLRLRLSWASSSKAPAGGEERTLVGKVERVGSLPAPAFSLPRARTDRERIAQMYREWCRSMSRRGVMRSEWMTPDEFARKVLDRLPDSAARIASLTDIFQRACYSKDPIDEDDVRTVRELVERRWIEEEGHGASGR